MPTAKTTPLLAGKPRHASLRVLYIGTALLILVLSLAIGAVILHLRASELLDQGNQLKNLSLILAEQADRSFQSVDLVISSVTAGVAADGVTDAASFDRIMASHDVHLLLQEKMSGSPQLDAIAVIGHDGKLVNFSRSWPIPEENISDRAYFQVLKANSNLTSYITEPVQNRGGTGTWTIYLAHRVNGPDGTFLGLILGAIQLKYFEDFYQAISSGNETSIGIERTDGVMLARFPPADAVGKTFYSAEHLLRGDGARTSREVSLVDGRMRLKAAHLLTNYPVFALATKTEDAALANWWATARLMSLAGLGCVISIAIAAFAFGRQWKHQVGLANSQAELRRQEDRAVTMGAAVGVAQATALAMTHSAEHDFLTGLPNRLLLNDRINQAIAAERRNKKAVAVLFLDLDGFKHINDSLGHAIGDKLLQSVAKLLVDCVRASDTVSRLGGDEFVVLLSEMERTDDAAVATSRIVQPYSVDQHEHQVYADAAITAAGRILKALAEPHFIDQHDLHVTASIGISAYPDDGLDAETLIKNADTAMYQAKEQGRQSYRFFEPEMNVRAVERQFIEASLRRAVERRQFLLHYQPIIDLATGKITGAEALIRWMHPERGLIPPMQFIPVAEDCGLMVPIGAWVLHEACRQARAWVDAGLPKITMAVNASAMELRNENFLENLFAILGDTGFDPKALVLELTESVLMKHAESAASILRILRERGIQMAIDDFGTGYSSLAYLRKLPLDALKIDQSFVRQIDTAGEDTAIVTAVIGMAQSLKLRVIAEGVETPEELEFLRAHHCDEVQGYYFSRPVPAEQFAKLLRTGIPEPSGQVRIPLASVDLD